METTLMQLFRNLYPIQAYPEEAYNTKKKVNTEWDIHIEPHTYPAPIYAPIKAVTPDDRGVIIEGGVKKWELVKLPAGKYRLADKEYEYPEFVFPATTIVHPRFSNRITETPHNGRNGYNLEVVNFGGASVTLKGIIWKGCFRNTVDELGYPYDELALLKNAVSIPAPREIVNEKLTTLGIYRVQVVDHDYPPLDGFPFVQPFEVQMRSYDPIEIVAEQGEIKFIQSRYL